MAGRARAIPLRWPRHDHPPDRVGLRNAVHIRAGNMPRDLRCPLWEVKLVSR